MKKHLCLLFLAQALLILPAQASPIVVNGDLTTSSFLGTDSSGNHFYYDIYNVSNPTGNPITVNISATPAAQLAPMIELWSGIHLPTSNWESPVDLYASAYRVAFSSTAGTSIVVPSFQLPSAATYQLAMTTYNYVENGAQLGTYTLTIAGDGASLNGVPEPSSLALFASAACMLIGVSKIRAKYSNSRERI